MPEPGSRNRLDKRQQFRLNTWMASNLERFARDNVTSKSVAQEATTALGFEVNDRNVRGVAGGATECLMEHRWPSSGYDRGDSEGGGNHTPRRLAVVIAVVERLIDKMRDMDGGSMTSLPEFKTNTLGDLSEIWDELVASSSVPSGSAEEGSNGESEPADPASDGK